MYKIFEITYNDGGWHYGPLPHAYYIAKNKEEVIANSKHYAEFFERKQSYGGDVWIVEVKAVPEELFFENLSDFELKISKKVDN